MRVCPAVALSRLADTSPTIPMARCGTNRTHRQCLFRGRGLVHMTPQGYHMLGVVSSSNSLHLSRVGLELEASQLLPELTIIDTGFRVALTSWVEREACSKTRFEVSPVHPKHMPGYLKAV